MVKKNSAFLELSTACVRRRDLSGGRRKRPAATDSAGHRRPPALRPANSPPPLRGEIFLPAARRIGRRPSRPADSGRPTSCWRTSSSTGRIPGAAKKKSPPIPIRPFVNCRFLSN